MSSADCSSDGPAERRGSQVEVDSRNGEASRPGVVAGPARRPGADIVLNRSETGSACVYASAAGDNERPSGCQYSRRGPEAVRPRCEGHADRSLSCDCEMSVGGEQDVAVQTARSVLIDGKGVGLENPPQTVDESGAGACEAFVRFRRRSDRTS